MPVHTIIKSDFHRNGISGAGFCVTIFEDETGRRFVGIRLDAPRHCAVLELEPLSNGIIEFGLNSWRGDYYEPDLARTRRPPVLAHQFADRRQLLRKPL